MDYRQHVSPFGVELQLSWWRVCRLIINWIIPDMNLYEPVVISEALEFQTKCIR